VKRILLVLIAAGLVVAPAAAAKGPHAIMSTPREPVEPGKPWQFTIELNEFRRSPAPAIIGRLGATTVGAEIQRTPSSVDGATAFRITMIFPRRGEWRLRLFAGHRRFALPTVDVGGERMPRDYVAFPVGSSIEGEGGGINLWLLPLLGVAVAGAGVAAVNRRRSR
jgi:hypothetical protein